MICSGISLSCKTCQAAFVDCLRSTAASSQRMSSAISSKWYAMSHAFLEVMGALWSHICDQSVLFCFFDLDVAWSPACPSVISRLESPPQDGSNGGEVLLGVGCCLD